MHYRRVCLLLVFCTALFGAQHLRADSTRAECGFAESVDAPRGETSACTFSQRQGHINIDIDGGATFDLLPSGDAPGNYTDGEGRAVYRRSGLGDRGTIFKLPNQFLFVYWDRFDCPAEMLAGPAGCKLVYGDVVFTLHATGEGSLNQLDLQVAGLELGQQTFSHEIDGAAYRAEVADLDADGWPEVYVYISAAGSGSYGSLVAYAVNNGKSATPIYLQPLTDDPVKSAGYMGHDEFAVVENRLVRRFPVYLEGDTNSAPSGGTRQLQYKLAPGEAGWILVLDRVVNY
ncbi:MAG: PliI family lysozyme inhibitor of I-type lysozyme [Gammaproteobacteria bacterium]|jgi:hypothetical protein